MWAFVWLMLLAYARLVSTADTNNAYFSSPSPVQSIFLLAGQSNMSGRGGVINRTWDGIIPSQSQSTTPNVLRLSAEQTWVQAQEPLHKDIDVNNTCGIGPGMAFANALMNKDPSIGVVGLVPCAIGGTKISEWGRGTNLYNRLVRRAEAALQGGGIIRALLWYQGESDTSDHVDAKLYRMRLERLFTHLRADLQLPALPVIQVALASGQGPYMDVVRKAQLEVDLPNVKTVDAYGLPMEPDCLHLSTSAQVQLGEMLAAAFLQSVPLPVHVQSSAGRTVHNFVLDSFFRPFRPRRGRCITSDLFYSSRMLSTSYEPIHVDFDAIKTAKTCGVGPDLVSANTLLEIDFTIEPVGLVPNDAFKDGGVVQAFFAIKVREIQ